ncbi:MAG: cytochrome c oxidase subunit II [Burkholderiales bacterium]|nr:cytochrome c oxidase subunit II [Burkholderiales bacterium]
MKARLANTMVGGFVALCTAVMSGVAHSAFELNLQPAQTEMARQMYDLHNLILLVCAVIFVIVFGIMFYSIVKHRRSVGHKAQHFHENTTVEILWTIIPLFILVGMAYPATKTILAMKDTSSPDMTIKVTGYQWKWGYDYLQDDIHFYSNLTTPTAQIRNNEPKGEHYLLEVDNPMVVPTGKRVRVLLTANDVIHAWWVPALGVKQDAIPGFIRDSWFKVDKEGTYRGQCAELCGKDHAFMPIVVEAVSPEKYAQWVAAEKQKSAATKVDPNKKFALDELKALGEKVYASNCVACHQANGQGLPGVFAAVDGSKIATGDKNAHIDIVLNGKPGTAMAPFKQLSDVDIAAVVTYERNSWSNKTGDAIQPTEIKAVRK